MEAFGDVPTHPCEEYQLQSVDCLSQSVIETGAGGPDGGDGADLGEALRHSELR